MKKWYLVQPGDGVNQAFPLEAETADAAKQECVTRFLQSWSDDLPCIVHADPDHGWVDEFGGEFRWPDPEVYTYIPMHRGNWETDKEGNEEWNEKIFWFEDEPEELWEGED